MSIFGGALIIHGARWCQRVTFRTLILNLCGLDCAKISTLSYCVLLWNREPGVEVVPNSGTRTKSSESCRKSNSPPGPISLSSQVGWEMSPANELQFVQVELQVSVFLCCGGKWRKSCGSAGLPRGVHWTSPGVEHWWSLWQADLGRFWPLAKRVGSAWIVHFSLWRVFSSCQWHVSGSDSALSNYLCPGWTRIPWGEDSGTHPSHPQVREGHSLASLKGRWGHFNRILSSLGECGNSVTGRKIIAFSPKAARNNFYFNGENRTLCVSGRFTLQAVMSEKMSFF